MESSRSTYFVTGATGFIGKTLCTKLRADDIPVVTITKSFDQELADLGVDFIRGSLWDDELLAEKLKDAKVIIHCAGNARFGNGDEFQRDNVELTAQLLEKADKNTKFVFLSTLGAVDRAASDACSSPLTEESPNHPSSDYGHSKVAAEELVKKSNLTYAILRPTLVIGQDMRYESHYAVFARSALKGSLLSRIHWPGKFSTIDVSDLADAIILCCQNPQADNQTYFCAGEAITLGDFFATYGKGTIKIPKLFIGLLTLLHKFLPFKLKSLFFSCLVASDQKLRTIGWGPKKDIQESLSEVVKREQARLDIQIDPGGQTVITGAASGLGKSLAERFAPTRRQLLLIDVDLDGLQAIKGKYPHCDILQADLSNPEGLIQLFNSYEWKKSPIYELITSAGIGARGIMESIPEEKHLQVFSLNVHARLSMALNVIEGMKRNKFGRIVFISSSSAFQPLPYMATYAASNSALLSLGNAWDEELAGTGVQIMTACPGGMQTNFQSSSGVKELSGEKLMHPDEAAEIIINGLNKGRQTLYVSMRTHMMALLSRLMPRRLSVRLWGLLMRKLR